MKRIVINLLILMLVGTSCSTTKIAVNNNIKSDSQIWSDNSTFNEFLDKNYKNGSKDFLITIYQSINYPVVARDNCRIGKLKTRIHINKSGQTEKVEFSNELGYGIEKEVKRVLKITENNWIASDTIRIQDFIFAFQLGETPIIKGDINVTAYNKNNTAQPNCTSSEELLKELMGILKKEKYKKAKNICEELLRREPESKHYNNLNSMILGKLNK